jgi:diadenosine tetraphosphate (Ap4A) HIT family hydrolase
MHSPQNTGASHNAAAQGKVPLPCASGSMSETSFDLHPQLAKDTTQLGDLPLSRVLLIDDRTYPWLLLVPRRRGVSEITDLGAIERAHLMTEITQVADALKAETDCHKINIAALGNVVPQLHVHVIARFREDAAWPRPVWGQVPATRYEASEKADVVARLRRRIWLSG